MAPICVYYFCFGVGWLYSSVKEEKPLGDFAVCTRCSPGRGGFRVHRHQQDPLYQKMGSGRGGLGSAWLNSCAPSFTSFSLPGPHFFFSLQQQGLGSSNFYHFSIENQIIESPLFYLLGRFYYDICHYKNKVFLQGIVLRDLRMTLGFCAVIQPCQQPVELLVLY